jgi:hypothetical protein
MPARTPATHVKLALFAAAVLLAPACSDDVERDEEGNIEEEGDVGAFNVREGDCFSSIDDLGAAVTDLPAVPCDQPHGAEVIHVFDMPDGEYPGDEAVQAAIEEGCNPVFLEQPYAEDLAYNMSMLFPDQRTWDELDDREIVCIATGEFPYEPGDATEETTTDETTAEETVPE